MNANDIRAAVEQRATILDSAASQNQPAIEKSPAKLDANFVVERLYRNRVGDADLFCALFRGKYLFVEEWGRWLYWAGHHWELDMREKRALADVERVCATYQDALVERNEPSGSALDKLCKNRLNKLRTAAGRKEVLECAISIDNPPTVSIEEIDQQAYLMATPTGVIDLRTGECRDGKPEQYLLNACPTPWLGIDTPCPAFEQYLLACMDDDQEMADFIVRLLGYGLLGEKNLHIWAIMYGPLSRNGKDTLMNTVKRILGKKLHARISVSLLVEQKFQQDAEKPQAALMAIRGAKIAYASEANARQSLDQAKIKDLTGGGYITARGLTDKYMTEWKQSALLVLLTNYLPKMDTDDDGFNARTICVEWPVKFVSNPSKPWERQIDYDMAKKLESEESGILALLVRGCMDVVQNGLRIPERVLAFTRDQIAAQDDIGRFVKECCIVEDPPTGGRDYTTRTASSDLLAICNWWAKKVLGNSYPYTQKKFTPALGKKGIPSKKSSNMFYLGVLVREEIRAEYEKDMAEERSKKGKGAW
ncbi:MAG: phage/plasmid primase, P4 family [Pseudomonadota bacterium]